MELLPYFVRRVNEIAKEDELDELEESSERPAEPVRKRRSKDRSYKLMTAFRPVRSRRR
jgi:hypothetical protein